MDHSLLHNTVYYLLAAIIAVPLFRKLGLGAILGYLTAGAIIGPQALHLIEDPDHALHFAEFGVVMLLFVIGLELNPEKLWQMRGQIAYLGCGQLLGCAALIALPLHFLIGMDFSVACLLGLTLGLSSTAFAIQLMGEQGIMGLPLGRKGFSILLLQDLAVIPILLLVGFLAPDASDGHANSPWWLGPLIIFAVLVIGRFVLNPALKLIANSGTRELLTAAALLIVLGTAWLMQLSGLTMGMGAFIAGIVLANSSFRHQLEADIEPFKGLLLGLFFIAVGMSLDLSLFVSKPLQILAFALALMAVKTTFIAALIKTTRSSWKDGFLLGLLLSQGGEFAFVVMNKAFNLQLLSAELSNQVVLVVGLSMALTSPLIIAFKKLTQNKVKNEEVKKYDAKTDDDPEVIIAGFGRFGQIVGRILAAHDLHFTALDKDAKHVDFVRQFGNKIFFGDAARFDLMEAAGVKSARILVVAVDNIEDSLSIVEQAKEHCPKIKIIARARNRAHAYQLYQAKVSVVIRETLESSLVAAEHTLIALGYTESQAIELVDLFRRHDENLVARASAHKDNMDELIEIAAEGRRELEQLFQLDHK